MSSEIASDIVNNIFADDKAGALDATKDAISAASYDLVQAKKADWAKNWGYDPAQTGQAAADAVAASLPDGTNQAKDYVPSEEEPTVETEPEAPQASAEPEATQDEEQPDETNS